MYLNIQNLNSNLGFSYQVPINGNHIKNQDSNVLSGNFAWSAKVRERETGVKISIKMIIINFIYKLSKMWCRPSIKGYNGKLAPSGV